MGFEVHFHAFTCSTTNLFPFNVITYFHQSCYDSEGRYTCIINLTLCARTHTHTQGSHTQGFCDAALLGLMVMCFMSVPCCGCVSQAERLTNCSILLNVRVMEAINGSELIAVTHLAACYRILPFTTYSEDLVLSRCLIPDRFFGPWRSLLDHASLSHSTCLLPLE